MPSLGAPDLAGRHQARPLECGVVALVDPAWQRSSSILANVSRLLNADGAGQIARPSQ